MSLDIVVQGIPVGAKSVGKFMNAVVGLFVASMPAHASELNLTVPTIAGQPVVVVQVTAEPENQRGDTIVILENRSSKSVKDVWLVLAGTNCKKMPGWPVIRYSSIDGRKPDRPPIEPRSRADMRIAKKMVRQVSLVAETTYGRRIPSQIVVDIVEFTDGNRWTLGEAVKHGGRLQTAPAEPRDSGQDSPSQRLDARPDIDAGRLRTVVIHSSLGVEGISGCDGDPVILPLIRFAAGSAIPDRKENDALRKVAACTKRFSSLRLGIQGHADRAERVANLQALSEERARAVRDGLVAFGADPACLDVVGFAARKPLSRERSAHGRGPNQRVEFTVLER